MTTLESQVAPSTVSADELFEQSQRLLDDTSLLLMSSAQVIAKSKQHIARFAASSVEL